MCSKEGDQAAVERLDVSSSAGASCSGVLGPRCLGLGSMVDRRMTRRVTIKQGLGMHRQNESSDTLVAWRDGGREKRYNYD